MGHWDCRTMSAPLAYRMRSSVLRLIVRAAPALNTPIAIVMIRKIIRNWYWLLDLPT
ncbi:hypothetical protein D9M72_639280 [compost metagenome]